MNNKWVDSTFEFFNHSMGGGGSIFREDYTKLLLGIGHNLSLCVIIFSPKV